jgi:Glycosyl hydrolase family 99
MQQRSKWIVWVVMVCVCAGLVPLGRPPAVSAAGGKKVFAYYYSWWNRLSWDPSRMSDRPPELYDSKSESVIRRQIEQAKSAGIDGFFCTWRYSCAKVVSVAEAVGGFSVAFSVDPVGDPTLNSDANIRKNMREMMGYMQSPAYLRIDGKPVFVFWNENALPGRASSKAAWQALRDDIDPNREQFWLGGGVSFGLLDVFDALHFYDITWEAASGKAMSSYNRKLGEYNSSRGAAKPFFATVMPGYDDMRYRGGHRKDRSGGDYYRSGWDNARAYDAQYAVITSWNEWFEGSSIEPSNAYGEQYLDITREKTAQFKDSTPVIRPGFADSSIKSLWQRGDLAIEQGKATRSWIWGPRIGDGMLEAYNGGQRLVQYFDKSRMEINNPNGDRGSGWYVTNGLLVTEMMTGRIQTGETTFTTATPSAEVLAGDPAVVNPDAPRYATLAVVATRQPPKDNQVADLQLLRDGSLRGITPPTETRNSLFVAETGHNIPAVFVAFLNQRGVVYEGGDYVDGQLFDWVFAFGYPITEAYWIQTKIAGVPQWTLVQAFERRILTYTPSNPAGYQVEMGNVGQHYYRWRYGK